MKKGGKNLFCTKTNYQVKVNNKSYKLKVVIKVSPKTYVPKNIVHVVERYYDNAKTGLQHTSSKRSGQ